MSHLKERKEKTCLNCNAVVYGRFCHICGQENIEPKESFWHLVTHFTYDVTHFDGKFFSTLRYLLFKPGFLSHEYLKGRRADYLHPIRMYVFTSAFFFLIFFSVGKKDDALNINVMNPSAETLLKTLERKKASALKALKKDDGDGDSSELRTKVMLLDSDIALLSRDTSAKDRLKSINQVDFIGTGSSKYKSLAEYDSVQHALPSSRRDNFFMRRLERQNLHLKEKYKNDTKGAIRAAVEKFQHLFPQMLFVSLPLFALILLLLYVRRKSIYYVNHVVYTIHLYCATFIIILGNMAMQGLFDWFGWKGGGWVPFIFATAGFFYWYKAMRNFYRQSRGKTIAKYLLMMFLSLILMVFLFSIFFIFSAMAI